jgi:hypothetical protein
MQRCARLASLVLALFVIAPSAAYAQASITGVVRDSSGAVLPGVTVEAASPALIEKVRSVVSDGGGQYRIENLRPGDYVVTFSLAGFSTVKREGLQLTGTFVATVNAEMRVGSLEETITVTGETPTVDVQSTTRERVFDKEIIDSLPSSRAPQRMAALIPGVTTGRQDVGGILGDGTARGEVNVRGNPDARMHINGVSNQATSQSDTAADGAYNMAAYQEMAVDTGGIGAEYSQGGLRMNMIPRDGGNTYHGSFLTSFADNAMQSDNLSQDLKDRGLGTADAIKRLWDINPAFGGPIKRDKLWFHATTRWTGASSYVALFYNKNAGNPNAWTYEPDTSKRAFNDHTIRNANARLTWQATQKHKFGISIDPSRICDCPRFLVANTALEASLANHVTSSPKRYLFGDWSAPQTNRLLLEGSFVRQWSFTARPHENPYLPAGTKLVSVTEQATGMTYRATASAHETNNQSFFARAAMSYITGAHAFKAGFNYGWGTQDELEFTVDSPMRFRFRDGVPNQVTLEDTPFPLRTNMDADHGLFVQDRWTLNRLTLTAGLRYDLFHITYPETLVGPGEFNPNRHLVFPKEEGVKWQDVTPRSGAAYDLFGTGKTALKVTLNKYLGGQAATGTFGADAAPASRLTTETDRSWTDANRNFVPDCNLLLPAANGECGAMSNVAFGTTRPGLAFDPDVLTGFGKRRYNWQFTAGAQHEILPRVSLDVNFWRTWFGNFVGVVDRAVTAADFDTFSITAPVDPRLPGGGGYVISGLYDRKPQAFGVPADAIIVRGDQYGKQTETWQGVDISVNARPRAGLLLTGGTNTQKRSTNNCDIVDQVGAAPGRGGRLTAFTPSPLYCDTPGKFLTQVKFVSSYTLPRWDVQVSAALQSNPGPELLANYTATTAEIRPSLGRDLSGGARNVTVNLIAPRSMYGERLNQLDLRFGKIVRIDRVRANIGVDLYNALNAAPVITVNNAFATWLQPQSILPARFAKVVLQLDF